MTPPPIPEIVPEKVVDALVRVSVLLPSATLPLPLSVMIEAPEPVAEMLNVPGPATLTSLESSMFPLPESANVPALIAVSPL